MNQNLKAARLTFAWFKKQMDLIGYLSCYKNDEGNAFFTFFVS